MKKYQREFRRSPKREQFPPLLRFLPSSVLVMAVLPLIWTAWAESAWAEALDFDSTRHGVKLKSVFTEVAAKAEHLVVQVEINSGKKCTGTLVEVNSRNGTGIIVCKASLLGESISKQDQFRCCDAERVWRKAEFLGYEKELDMCFLNVDFSDSKPLPTIPIAKTMKAGQWLVSLEYGRRHPGGVGVLGAEPRTIGSSRGFAGLNVDETDHGLAITKVMANSGASRAGLKRGDHLMESEEKHATKRRWFSKLLRQYEPGDWLPLLAKRGNMLIHVDLQIGTPWTSTFERQAVMNRFGSDVSRRKTGFRSVLQHDTILHPQKCGGPIVNLQGELVGVNIARAGRTDTLAVPIQEIIDTAKQFEKE